MLENYCGRKSVSFGARIPALLAFICAALFINACAERQSADEKNSAAKDALTENVVVTPTQPEIDLTDFRTTAENLLRATSGIDDPGGAPHFKKIWSDGVDELENDLTEFAKAMQREEDDDPDPIIVTLRSIAGPPLILPPRDKPALQFYEKIKTKTDKLRTALHEPLPCTSTINDIIPTPSVCANRYDMPTGSSANHGQCCSTREESGWVCLSTCLEGICDLKTGQCLDD